MNPLEPRHLTRAEEPLTHRLLDQVSAFQYATVPNAPTYRGGFTAAEYRAAVDEVAVTRPSNAGCFSQLSR